MGVKALPPSGATDLLPSLPKASGKGLLVIQTLTKHHALQTANKHHHHMRRSQAPPPSSEEQMPANPCQLTSRLPTLRTSRRSESSTFHLQTSDQNLPRLFAPPARYSESCWCITILTTFTSQ